MANAKRDLSHLAELSGSLGLHEHICVIYKTQDEQLAAALPYLKAGLERSERCLYVTGEHGSAPVLDALRQERIDVDHYLGTRALIVTEKHQTRPGNHRFEPDWWIDFLTQRKHEAVSDKFSGLRILGEMTWALGEHTPTERFIEFEAKFNFLAHEHDVRGLCLYNGNRFSPELTLSVLRTHPVVAYGGHVCKNPYYVPPEEFLKPNQPAREVQRFLNNILKYERSLTQLRSMASRLQTVRETEQTHLVRELHDEIGQLLTGLRMLLLPNRDPSAYALATRLEQARTIVDDLIARVRALSFDLRPVDLDQLGLLPALLTFFDRYTAQTGILVKFTHQGLDRRFSPMMETGAYRIVQEALTNTARHAGVAEVAVRVWSKQGKLSLVISDRGGGFDADAALLSPLSSGLVGMRERVLGLGGQMTIESSPKAGTAVIVNLPLDETTKPDHANGTAQTGGLDADRNPVSN
jgi:signal transduction histidine kinase